jgi:hypothetical protein
MTFESILNSAPLIVQEKFPALRQLRERPDFHPEESAAEHIRIVTERCIRSGLPNLIMTALFHDLFKAETARLNPKNGWPTCPGHDSKGEAFIRNNVEVQEFITIFGADWNIVAWLVGQHMRIAQIDNMRASKQAAFRAEPHFDALVAFHFCDDMTISNEEAISNARQILAP